MKILFAVNNDNVSETIVKKYQKEYKEILSYKNVYYFNAIYRELQKDKSYSRVVISEDLEPFANNNYNAIDKFLLEKYNNISQEAKSANGEPIDIILICADRRKNTDDIFIKLYNNQIYNAIIGQDRSIEEVCRLINQPRDKADAKGYYNIQESELKDNDTENSVSEAEVENIRAHYARLGKNEDKYVDSFNNIVAQYTDAQLKIIIKYLPMNVKAVLEERSPKYQQLVTTTALGGIDVKRKTDRYKEQLRNKREEDEQEENVVEQLIKPKNIKTVVVPKNITTANVQKVVIPSIKKPEVNQEIIVSDDLFEDIEKEEIQKNEQENILSENQEVVPQKRGRGRPRKNVIPEDQEQKPKRGRGRPRKQPVQEEQVIENKQSEEIDLFEMGEQEDSELEKEVNLFDIEEETKPEIDLFSIEDEEENEEVDLLFEAVEEDKAPEIPAVDLFSIDEEEAEVEVNSNTEPILQENIASVAPYTAQPKNVENDNYITTTNNANSSFNTLLTADKKIVSFVGTTKNGTSFIVNNTAEMLASMGIETAILDMTKSKNAYYIYTNNEESLRNVAKDCMENLQNGIAEGIKVKKNLTVYTEMPGDEREYEVETILGTLLKHYSAILIDTDFDTKPEIFEKSQEIFLVQTMDVLTIQPLTAFLRNLKSKNILKPEKLKIVINKSQRVKGLNVKTLIGGMSCYNSPNMTYMTELFNRDNIIYCEVPFEVQNYVKYLEYLVNCSISLNGYTKQMISALREVANMVYPLVNKKTYSQANTKRSPFSSEINSTLDKMKNKY